MSTPGWDVHTRLGCPHQAGMSTPGWDVHTGLGCPRRAGMSTSGWELPKEQFKASDKPTLSCKGSKTALGSTRPTGKKIALRSAPAALQNFEPSELAWEELPSLTL